jgi:hypothetical protein
LLDRFYPGGLTAMEKDWHSMIARGASGMQGWRLVEPKK